MLIQPQCSTNKSNLKNLQSLLNLSMSNLNKEKVAVVFISGSVGELDCILPILDYLLHKKFKIKII